MDQIIIKLIINCLLILLIKSEHLDLDDSDYIVFTPQYVIRYVPETEIENSFLDEESDPILESARRHKHNQNNWSYSVPNWISNSEAAGNILRTPDPRNLIHSSSGFTQITKPFGGSFVHSHQTQSIIGGHNNAHHHFPQHHHLHDLHSPVVNKNTNIHIHNRNVQEQQNSKLYSGSHLFLKPTATLRRRRRDVSGRNKRGLLEFMRLIADHNARVDMPRTVENVGAVTRDVFEHEHSPVYHLRDTLGSAQDAFYCFLNAKPSGLLIPSSYRIADAQESPDSPIVGGINPSIYTSHGLIPPNEARDENGEENLVQGNDPLLQHDDTLHRVGNMLRESVHWAQKSAEHAVNAMHSARQVVATTKEHWPEIFLPYAGTVELAKPTLGDNEVVGAARDPEFVGMGKIMDYFGMTDMKPADMDPRLSQTHSPTPEEHVLLNTARSSLGADTYRQFIEKMKKEIERQQRKNDLLLKVPYTYRKTINKLREPITKLQMQQNLKQALKLPKATEIKPILEPSNLDKASLKLPSEMKPSLEPSNLDKLRASLKLPKVKSDLEPSSVDKIKASLKLPKAKSTLEPPNLDKLKASKQPQEPSNLKLSKLPDLKEIEKSNLDNLKLAETKAKEKMNALRQRVQESLDRLKQSPPSPPERLRVKEPKQPQEPPNLKLSKLPDLKEIEKSSLDNLKLAETKAKEKMNALRQRVQESLDRLKQTAPSPPERLRARLAEKYNLPQEDNKDLLGQAIKKLREKSQTKSSSADPEEVGTPGFIPVPIFTKEMKTPFMGIATKEDMDKLDKLSYGLN